MSHSPELRSSSSLRVICWPTSASSHHGTEEQTAEGERERIEREEGQLDDDEGRVVSPATGAGLAPGRVFGDFDFKVPRPLISATPVVTPIPLAEAAVFAVMSDEVSDPLEDYSIVARTNAALHRPTLGLDGGAADVVGYAERAWPQELPGTEVDNLTLVLGRVRQQ